MLSRSVVSDCETPGTVAREAPLSMGFSRQEYWSGLPCPPPGDLPNPGINPRARARQADSLSSEPPGKAKYFSNWIFIFQAKGTYIQSPPDGVVDIYRECMEGNDLSLSLSLSHTHTHTHSLSLSNNE